MNRFEHILVANRGEIAIRIMQTARALGYRTTAIYSEVDADSPHVRYADEAYLIGPAQAGESYLNIEKILHAAAASGAGALHPGYGFLSENAAFAKACEKQGVVFIGPHADAIELMGNKAAAKQRILAAGVPCVPGYQGDDQSEQMFAEKAAETGYPIMVKAADGGGGRGMRLVTSEADLPAALRMARSEALGAFASDQLILEKAIVRPRHVEIQVLADTHGNIIHLGERDCSVQRRHQKIIEEAPCPGITSETRAAMAASAIDVARSIDYVGAGTVEFLLDGDSNYYFIEMNTRLQVEHGVTEMITGLDLVALQIQVAQGEVLPLTQADVTISGHAIETRVYAEDPDNDFLPSPGLVHYWQAPEGAAVRVDNGIETGQTISPYYDSMVAKIVTWSKTRDSARLKLLRALQGTVLFGPKSNLCFLTSCLQSKGFVMGTATTALIAEEIEPERKADHSTSLQTLAIAAALQYRHDAKSSQVNGVSIAPALLNWSSTGVLRSRFQYLCHGERRQVNVSTHGGEVYSVSDNEGSIILEILQVEGRCASLRINERNVSVMFFISADNDIYLMVDGVSQHYTRISTNTETAVAAGGDINIIAPMHGCVLELFVQEGEVLKKGDRVAVLEAMKMQHMLRAGDDAVVEKISVGVGEQVVANKLLIELRPLVEAGGD